MDSILAQISAITTTLKTMIPSEFLGVPTLYIGLALLILLILIVSISKAMKAKPKRELSDLFPAELEETDYSEFEDKETADNEDTIEDGFMPSNVSNDQDNEMVVIEPEVPITPEAEEEKVAVESTDVVAPETAASEVVRKKRDSTRQGRKITKSDFSDFSGSRILIAEDNLINQKVINGVLNESGIDIVMADDGQFVMDILEKDSDFEIILMDAHMPRVDGFEATRMIRKNSAYNHITVIALSGDTAVDDIRHMTEAGMEEHLEKPLKMDALYDMMSMYFSMGETEVEEPIVAAKVTELEIEVDIDDLPCLDYDQGLEICGNDEIMYKELLKDFFVGYKNSSKKMHEALVNKNFKEAQDILIDVKGTASNLGAVQFITITEHFLQALADENTASYSKMFKDYQNYLLALLKSIQAAFKQ